VCVCVCVRVCVCVQVPFDTMRFLISLCVSLLMINGECFIIRLNKKIKLIFSPH